MVASTLLQSNLIENLTLTQFLPEQMEKENAEAAFWSRHIFNRKPGASPHPKA